MKFETVILHSLFAACMVLCLAVMSAMLILPTPTAVAASHAPAMVNAAAG